MSHTFNNTSRGIRPTEQLLKLETDLITESGVVLENPLLAFQTWGRLNADRSNVVWVCHALTGNHRVQEWWDGLFGAGKCFDPADWFIICVNIPGSAYGSVGPLSFRQPNERYYRSFPLLTPRDVVQAFEAVRTYLAIEKVNTLIGASVGGQHAIEWLVQQPQLFERVIPIAANVKHSPFGIAFNESQRLAIEADPTFSADELAGGRKGLIAARSIAMLSYRTPEGYTITQSENQSKTDNFKASSYQRYQGEKLANRFNAYSYWHLTKLMDAHDISRGRRPVAELLAEINVPALVVGIDSDLLFPLAEQQLIAENLPNGELAVLSSHFGHDGFLVEFAQLSHRILQFLQKTTAGNVAITDLSIEKQ